MTNPARGEISISLQEGINTSFILTMKDIVNLSQQGVDIFKLVIKVQKLQEEQSKSGIGEVIESLVKILVVASHNVISEEIVYQWADRIGLMEFIRISTDLLVRTLNGVPPEKDKKDEALEKREEEVGKELSPASP